MFEVVSGWRMKPEVLHLRTVSDMTSSSPEPGVTYGHTTQAPGRSSESGTTNHNLTTRPITSEVPDQSWSSRMWLLAGDGSLVVTLEVPLRSASRGGLARAPPKHAIRPRRNAAPDQSPTYHNPPSRHPGVDELDGDTNQVGEEVGLRWQPECDAGKASRR